MKRIHLAAALPVTAGYMPVPYYDPLVVFRPPHTGVLTGTAINYGFGVTLGDAFIPWGWTGGGRAR